MLAARGRNVCVLASGDPFFYGVGSVLANHVAPDETLVVPAPSSFSLAAARLHWALPDIALVSLHGRALERIKPHLHPGARVLALTSDSEGPEALARLLAETGFGESRLTVLEALGGAKERIRTTTAAGFDLGDIAELNVVGVEVVAAPGARIIAYAPGLADDLFEHDGQITKREIRAVTLSSLAPLQRPICCGTSAPAPARSPSNGCWRIPRCALRQSRPAPTAPRASGATLRPSACLSSKWWRGARRRLWRSLAAPDAVFIGGGASEPGVLDTAIAALKPGGRLVANAVTLETEAELIARQASLGGTLTRIAISRADSIGGKTGWRPAMPVTQWVWVKP